MDCQHGLPIGNPWEFAASLALQITSAAGPPWVAKVANRGRIWKTCFGSWHGLSTAVRFPDACVRSRCHATSSDASPLTPTPLPRRGGEEAGAHRITIVPGLARIAQ